MAAKQRAFAGEEYYDFNLVFALEDGFTVETEAVRELVQTLAKRSELDLPPLIFHELRHSSATFQSCLSYTR